MFFFPLFLGLCKLEGSHETAFLSILILIFSLRIDTFFQMFIMMWKDHNKRNYGTGFSGNIFVCKISGRLNPKIRFLIVKL